jgi:hypothetical protein
MQGANDTKQKRETRALTGMLKSLSYLRRLCPHRRQTGSYPETAFEQLIEANRHGTWTINAVTGKVGSSPWKCYASQYSASPRNELSVAWYIVLERETRGFDHIINGKAVAKAGDQLASLAMEKGLPTLMNFFSASPEELVGFAGDHGVSLNQPPRQKWFSADDGLKTINGLIDGAEKRKLDARVIDDLREFKTVLEIAKQNGVAWHLAIDF